jgi:DNA-binding NtrC family response regulator
MLLRYPWPGNIRELENVLERAIVLGRGNTLEPADLFLDMRTNPVASVNINLPFNELIRNHKKEIIREALRQCGGNQSRAAEKLAVSQPYLSRLMKKLGLRTT